MSRSREDWESDVSPEAAEGICESYSRRAAKGQPRGDLQREFVDKTHHGGSYVIVDPIRRRVRHISRAEWERHPNRYWEGLPASGASAPRAPESGARSEERDQFGLSREDRFGMTTQEYLQWNGGPPDGTWADDEDD